MLKISWRYPVFNYIYQRLIFGERDQSGSVTFKGMPDTTFFDKRFTVVPYVFNGQPFLIETNSPGSVATIKIVSTTSTNVKKVDSMSVVLQNSSNVINIILAEGLNYITVTSEGETVKILANARHYATLLYTYASELYKNMESFVDEHEQAMQTKFATRLVEPLIKVNPLLPTVKSLQMMSLRFITKTYMQKAMKEIGAKEFLSSLTVNSPYFSKPEGSTTFDPVRYPLQTYQEAKATKIAHVWLPNTHIIRWVSFILFVNNIQGFSVKDINENEVIIENNFGDQERHLFDFDAEKDFFKSKGLEADIVVELSRNFPISIVAPAYPFDLFVMAEAPLGDARPYFDSGMPFDMDLPFDTEELDPEHDGYIGLSLVGRLFDNNIGGNQFAYDTSKLPLVYDKGFHCQVVEIDNTEVTINLNPTVTATYG